MEYIQVKILEKEEYPLWDDLVELSPYGTIFHRSQWITAAMNQSSVNTEIFGAYLQDELIGGCAIHSQKIINLFTLFTSTFPLTPYGGFIIQPHESSKVREREKYQNLIIEALINAFEQRRPHYIDLTMSPQFIDIRPFIWRNWQEKIKYCYIFRLSENISEKVSKNVRRSINKAKKLGIITKREWDKDIYWTLTLNTYKKQGIQPPFSQKLLFSLMDVIQENQWGEMWIAETPSGEAVSSEIVIWDNKMAYRWSAASHDQYNNTGAPSLLLYDIMKHLLERNFHQFNLMAGNTPHLAKFISSFNPELVPYYSIINTRGLFKIMKILH